MHACASSALFECMAKNPIRTRARSYALPTAFEPGVMMMMMMMMMMMISRHRFPHAAEMSRTHILITENCAAADVDELHKNSLHPFFSQFFFYSWKSVRHYY
jgi:hypothetical protein